MKFFLFILTMLGAAAADWSFGYLLPSWFPPLPVSAILFWFLYFDFTARLAVALVGGAVLDSIYPVPFGSYTAVLIILAVVVEFLKVFIIQAANLFLRFLVFGVLLILGAVLLPLVIYIMENFLYGS